MATSHVILFLSLFLFISQTTASCSCCLPLGDSVFTWLRGDSYDNITKVWVDVSGNGHNSTETRGAPKVAPKEYVNGKIYQTLYGGTADTMVFSGAIGDSMTFFGLSRYASETTANRARIFTTRSPTNWYSGHVNQWSGVAGNGRNPSIGGPAWLTTQGDKFGNSWVLSVSQRRNYRGNGYNLTVHNIDGETEDPDHFTINNYMDTALQRSQWEVAEIIVYNRTLTTEEIEMVESYFNTHYAITNQTAVNETAYGDCYPPLNPQSPTTQPPTTAPPYTEPPVTEPPTTLPTTTPPPTEPPSTLPPPTIAPFTESPTTQPTTPEPTRAPSSGVTVGLLPILFIVTGLMVL